MTHHNSKRLFIGGNWKMNGTREAATLLANELVTAFEPLAMSVDAAIFPPFPYLQHIEGILRGSGLMLSLIHISEPTRQP
jgi:triosephosphate isomerase